MDDLIYRNNAIAEENIDPHGRPAKDEFEEFSEEVSEHTDLGYKEQKVKSAKERKKRLKEMDKIVKEVATRYKLRATSGCAIIPHGTCSSSLVTGS